MQEVYSLITHRTKEIITTEKFTDILSNHSEYTSPKEDLLSKHYEQMHVCFKRTSEKKMAQKLIKAEFY